MPFGTDFANRAQEEARQRATAGATGASASENAFFDSLLARRGRSIQNFARSSSRQLGNSLASRGLLGSGVEARGNLGIQQSAQREFGNAAQDVFGQQFAAQQQREAEARAFGRQVQLQNLSFEQQAALMRLQNELGRGGGFFDRLAGGLGGAIGGFVTGGPGGAAAGAAQGFFG